VVVLVRPAEGRTDSPERILADRFARGEIDEDEYQRRRHALRG
jgi:putative membrane protein